MNTQMTISEKRTNFVMNLVNAARLPLESLTEYYSNVAGQRFDLKQTLHLLNAQLAFIATVFPCTTVPIRALCLAWLIAAVLKCREFMISKKKEEKGL